MTMFANYKNSFVCYNKATTERTTTPANKSMGFVSKSTQSCFTFKVQDRTQQVFPAKYLSQTRTFRHPRLMTGVPRPRGWDSGGIVLRGMTSFCCPYYATLIYKHVVLYYKLGLW